MIRECPVCGGLGIKFGLEFLGEPSSQPCKNCNGQGFTADSGEEWNEELKQRREAYLKDLQDRGLM